MKKNIIIIGPPRSGKTTLAQQIVKELNGYSMISGDNFSSSYIVYCRHLKNYEININLPIIQSYYYLRECLRYENTINYVFETSHYKEDLIKECGDNFLIIILGYSKLTENDLFNNIRKYDQENDWTYIESDNKLKMYCKSFVEESKEKEQIAKEHNYWYVDTSYNRDGILNETFRKIKDIIDE